MTISYKWLSEYLPYKPLKEELSKILTSIGLEVESMEDYESVRGNLDGLVVGEVIYCTAHPNADKLKLTEINVGTDYNLQIVCGASNVAVGQKVVVAKPGVTIYPIKGSPIEIKEARIRNVESQGMICAEDEIGLGENHDGILILPNEYIPGKPVADYLKPYRDTIFEIGLTPNHMDAMSHLGVAREVCAYLSYHQAKDLRPIYPALDKFQIDNHKIPITVSIEDKEGCERFSGLSISGIQINPSPSWLQEQLKAIGIRPINNIVDITNFVLHETGQPLHAYDADRIRKQQVIVKKLPAGTSFVTLDEKKRTLSANDLMICDAEEGMCMAGVFGGLESGVQDHTQNIFLESAWFNPVMIRRTSFLHGLRTEAAMHFEKGMDISNTVNALKRAALLIKELAGGKIASDIIDIYPNPKPKIEVNAKYEYLKKISGKNYPPESVKNILKSLQFEMATEDQTSLTVKVPYHKMDISRPADLAEEIMRIDGYDRIDIPVSIRISPSVETDPALPAFRQKISGWLVGSGFSEIFTNSITNSSYYEEEEIGSAVKMINNLSSELNIMRPSLLETGLESVVYNLNRKIEDLKFFEFGKSYQTLGIGNYEEKNHLSLYITGNINQQDWKSKSQPADFFSLKGICKSIFILLRLKPERFEFVNDRKLENMWSALLNGRQVLSAGRVKQSLLRRFDIRQPIFFADFNWAELEKNLTGQKIEYRELPRQLPVFRDLALVVDKSVSFDEISFSLESLHLNKLTEIRLFDIFESEKIGVGKKSLAISLSFVDEQKTMTDKEIESMMTAVITKLEKTVKAEIRK
jgi:phenylalanyl-tRNA synthetase beta chain